VPRGDDIASKSTLEIEYLGRIGSHGKLFTSLVRTHLGIETERRSKTMIENERFRFESGREIEVLHCIASADYSQTEWDLHQRFADKRTHGEWFALEPPDLEWILAQTRL
jgi:hypothetical protein